jgi:hypothetical protein
MALSQSHELRAVSRPRLKSTKRMGKRSLSRFAATAARVFGDSQAQMCEYLLSIEWIVIADLLGKMTPTVPVGSSEFPRMASVYYRKIYIESLSPKLSRKNLIGCQRQR